MRRSRPCRGPLRRPSCRGSGPRSGCRTRSRARTHLQAGGRRLHCQRLRLQQRWRRDRDDDSLRGSQVAYYSTPAKVTADRVTARFGGLGELDYRFAPKRNGSIDCTGAEEGEAVFEGTFDFTGENGYVHIEADHAEGSFQIYPGPKNCPQKRLARRAVRYHPAYSDEGATLQARAGSRAKRRMREVIVFDEGGHGPHKVVVYATLVEAREGMMVARGVQLRQDPAPFAGTSRKAPRRCGRRRPVPVRRLSPATAMRVMAPEGFTGRADPRRGTSENDRRRVPRLHPQRRAAGRVRLAGGAVG